MSATLTRIGFSAHIEPPDNTHGGYDVFVLRNTLTVSHGDGSGDRAAILVTGLNDWLKVQPPRLVAVGWSRFDDGAEVVHLYDKTDSNFGYGFNITYPDNSEWGHSPFPIDETVAQIQRRVSSHKE